MSILKEKSSAVMDFVNTMIGAYESGFVDKINPTLSEIHQCARNHVKDNYGVDHPSMSEEWGEELTKECSD